MFEFNHVALSVKDLNKTISFYKFFGFKMLKEYHDSDVDIVHLKNKNAVIEVFHYIKNFDLPEHSIDRSIDLKTIGNKHFGLGVKNIECAKQKIEESGIYGEPINIVKGRLGKPYFFIKDPDGIWLEIIEK